jgi:hypothetical protein
MWSLQERQMERNGPRIQNGILMLSAIKNTRAMAGDLRAGTSVDVST